MATTSEGKASDAAAVVDEERYNRQLYVFGHEAQRKMQNSSVLLIGLRGVGVEIGKNIILSGVKSVTLFDMARAEWTDLSAQFYLSEADVGKHRAQACAKQLAELNPRVKVSVVTALTNEVIAQHQVVVATDCSLKQLIDINNFCRSRSPQIPFIAADVKGLFARVFTDFGDRFVVSDKNGEQPHKCLVGMITSNAKGVVTMHDGGRHRLEDGDFVTFEEVKGMTELNNSKPRAVKVINPHSFSIEDTTSYGAHKSGGYFRQVKQPVEVKCQSLQQKLADPGEFLLSDFGKMDRSPLMHLGWQALSAFQAKHNMLPSPGVTAHADELVLLTKGLNEKRKEEERIKVCGGDPEKVLRQFAQCACGQISAMAAVIGGIAAQEVLKACSGKFMPIVQWFYFDAAECLPSDLPASEFEPTKTRYDGQVAIFGRSLQKQIMAKSYFLVGAGAIGCEMLKTFAMMGLGTAAGATLHVTDMDHIERSNLSRQFLFRESDIKSAKSTAACRAAKRMNPELNLKAWTTRVGPDTEAVFGDDFWEDLYGVCTALDNVQARLYVDQRCVFYNKPLLESGTLGTKGNTQVVVPKLTENYGASRDPPEAGIPICTLKNFPHKIEHTIQWAREWFEGTFSHTPASVNNYLADPEKFLDTLGMNPVPTLEKVLDSLVTSKPVRFEECIHWARLEFQDRFSNSIRQLLHNFPKDQVDSNGSPFWSGTKRAPSPLDFDMNDPQHMNFVVAAANLRAQLYGLNGSSDRELFMKVLPDVVVATFATKDGVKIAANEEEAKAHSNNSTSAYDVDGQKKALIGQLPAVSKFAGYRMCPLEFEKDDDSNFHMDFVTATSNLRARNYRVKEMDLHNTKRIAGKIIPAIATTTALVAGLISLELYKVLQGCPLEAYRNAFLNLAVPLFALSEPVAPDTFSFRDEEWSIWDNVDLVSPLTLKQFMSHFETTYGLDVSMISYGSSILYSFFMNQKKRKKRLAMTMEALAPLVSKRPLDPACRYLIFEVMCTDPEDDEDVDIPTIRYKLRRR